jgi:hypothetical protein
MVTMHFLLFQNSENLFAYYVEAEESGSLFLMVNYPCFLIMLTSDGGF